MPLILKYFLRLIFFWLIFFALGRLIFLLFGLEAIKNENLFTILFTFIAALRIDLTTISYILIFPFILYLLFYFISPRLHFVLIKLYHFILIPVVVLITISGIKLFHEWGSLINYRAIVFMFEPDSITGSVAIADLLLLILFAGSFIGVGIYLFNKIVKIPVVRPVKTHIPVFVMFALLIAFGTRGGIKSPVNETASFYSDSFYLNNAAMNPIWYLGHSMNQASLKNIERYSSMNDETANRLINELFPPTTTIPVLKENNTNPNVVVIILESWSADLIERLGGVKGVTPVFDSLSRKGILFGDVYSSGFRTDQGLVSIFSGYPAQPSHSIIQNLDKVAKLPFVPSKLKERGYSSSFYYGGNINFSNMKKYLQIAGFDIIHGDDYFEGALFTNWGAHDEFVLLKQAQELITLQQPFMSCVLTLSTHEPYDVPSPLPSVGLSEPDMYNRSANYTDYSLGKYFEYAQSQPWFENTLFVITADHGHRLPTNYSALEKGIRHMPVLFYGAVIKEEFHGMLVEKTGNLHDIPVTVLSQLNINTNEFRWSKDLLSDESVPFAYIGYEKGFGWVQPENEYLLYFFPQGQITKSGKLTDTPAADSILNFPKAYIQTLYKEFVGL